MLGFKGFDKNLKCRDKQYEIGKTYEEDEAKLCNKGLHFCEHPLNCFEYYSPAENRFAEIEAEDVDAETSDDTKRVAKKITIKAELSIKGLVDAAIKFVFDRATWDDTDKTTGNRGAASATGDQGAASATGNRGAASATGNRGAASATGNRGAASATGDQGAASATGNRGAASATGDQGVASATGKNSVAMAIGYEGRASAAKGNWLTLAEWKKNKKGELNIKTVKTVKVDGKNIKPNTLYTLKNGEFIEADK